MSSSDRIDPFDEPTVDLELRIDQICDAFELSCQRNERPRIDDYLDSTVGEIETQIVELVLVELAYRKKAGETPRFEEYASRFPAYKDALARISDHFPADAGVRYMPPPMLHNLESYEFVGAGSFGSVWKAWDTKLRRFVAVKTPIRPVPTQTERQLILREAQIVARAKHPNVVPVYSVGEVDSQIFIVYEYVAGRTLRDFLRSRDVSTAQVVKICINIAQALDHVHQLGIVHRDLKPANILIDERGEPHVMDFGLAKLVDSASTIGVEGIPLGTYAYMSPEQAAGRSAKTDAGSDIYSLGAILYEMISGKLVFSGDAVEMKQKILFSPPPPLVLQGKDRDLSLERICRKCLEKDVRDRYRTAADLALDLQRYQNEEPVTARPVPVHIRFCRKIIHHRHPIIIVAVIFVPMIALLVLQNGSRSDPEPGTRVVNVVTEPAGATLSIVPCDPQTGEPDLMKRVALIDKTPKSINLLPGRYLLHATRQETNGLLKHEACRTVPGFDGAWPSMRAVWERSNFLVSGELSWEPISLKTPPLIHEMAYIPGTDEFVIQRPEGSKTVSVAPFFVATREFTFGDFLRIRAGYTGDVPGRPAQSQPENAAMPSRYDMAQQWAEFSGARLLTDLEFAYLAQLANESQGSRQLDQDESASFDRAGGSSFDEIPTNPPIRGILTGYAEWTSTWPRSPQATVKVSNLIDDPEQHHLYRIIRGGKIDCRSDDYPRDPLTAAAGYIYVDYPHVGFRLALTPPPNH